MKIHILNATTNFVSLNILFCVLKGICSLLLLKSFSHLSPIVIKFISFWTINHFVPFCVLLPSHHLYKFLSLSFPTLYKVSIFVHKFYPSLSLITPKGCQNGVNDGPGVGYQKMGGPIVMVRNDRQKDFPSRHQLHLRSSRYNLSLAFYSLTWIILYV